MCNKLSTKRPNLINIDVSTRCSSIGNILVRKNGVCNFTEKNAPREVSDSLTPWFMSEDMKIKDKNIFFGHWSTLGDFCHENISCLDAGCVWGGEMIAIDLDEPQKKIKYKSSIPR